MNKKKGNTNRILAILCAITMVVTLFPAGLWNGGAYAADEEMPAAAESAAPAEEQPAEKTDTKQEEETKPAETTPQQTEEKTATEEEKAQPEAAPVQKEAAPKEDAKPATEESKAEEQNKDAEKKDTEKEETYKVEFDLTDNYARFNPINDKTTEAGGKFTLPEKPEARKELYKAEDGKEYYFTGWEYKDKEYAPGDTLTLKSDAKFKAVWKQTYTIEFSAKGIKADEVEDQIEVYGEPVTLPDETASKDGYDFIGWTPDNGDTVYAPDTLIASSKIQPKRAKHMLKLKGVTEDTTAPDVYIQYKGKKEDVECLTFAVIGMDKGSGIDKVEVKIPGHSELEDWSVVGQDFSADLSDGETIYARATDKRGNVSEEKSLKAVYNGNYDTAAPIVIINKVDGEDGNAQAEVPKKEHKIDFSVNEAGCTLKAFVSGKDITDSITGDDASGYSLNVSGDELEDEETVSIIAVDAYDNFSETAIECKFDTTALSVTSFEMTGAANNFYYSANTKWDINVEASEDIETATFKIGEKSFSGTVRGNTATLTIGTEEIDSNFGSTTEGELDVAVELTDKAGNPNSADNQKLQDVENPTGLNSNKKIIVDTKAPELSSVTTSPASVETVPDKCYYDQNVKTTYLITEQYPADDIKLSYTKLDGTSGEVALSEDTIIAEWDTDSYEEYSGISLTGTDLAGNTIRKADGVGSSGDDACSDTANGISFNNTKVIDTEGPKATVTYTIKGATPYLYDESGLTAYTQKMISAEIKVKKHEHESWGDITLTCKDQDGNVIALNEGEATVTLGPNEGTYQLTLYGNDKALHPLSVTEKMSGAEGPAKGNLPEAGLEDDYKEDSPLKLKFVIDTTPPKYTSSDFTTVNLEANPGALDGNTAYYKEKINGSFSIQEEHFDENRIGADVITNTGEGTTQFKELSPEWPLDSELKYGSAAGFSGDATYNVEIEKEKVNEGVHRFIIYGEDKAGNKLGKDADSSAGNESYNATEAKDESKGQFQSMLKVLDITAPEFGFKVSDSEEDGYYVYYSNKASDEFKTEWGDEKYDPFRKNNKATVIVKGDDRSETSVQYGFISKVPGGSDEWKQEPEKTNETDVNYWTSAYDKAGLKKDKTGETQFRINLLKVTDRAGNYSSEYESNTIYLDGTAPTDRKEDIIKPQVKITSAQSVTGRVYNQPIYNDTVVLKFEISDPNKHKSSSGLKKIWYTAEADGNEVEGFVNKIPKGAEDITPVNLAEIDKDDKGLVYEMQGTIKIPKGKDFETNNIVVHLYAMDNSGNRGSDKAEFGIDSVGPKIVVRYDNNSAQNEKYFKANRTATITVTERNLGKNSDKIKIKTEVGVPGSWSYSAGGEKSGNSDKWIKRCSYTKDGDYTMAVSGTDALGNKASFSFADGTKAGAAFTIDKTAPVMKVTFDNNNVRNRKYYKANRTATIRIDEHNFLDSDVKVAGTAKKPRGGAMAFPGRSKFSSRGDTRTATIPFNKEGAFKFNVNYTDLAGNPAKVVVIDEFVIDKTNPTVKIENVINGGIYGGTVAPRAVFDDDTFSRSDSVFRFTGIRKVDRSELIPAFRSNGEFGGSYNMSNFPNIKINDDIYTAYASSTDLAGNTTTVSVTFSVNRFGSAFDYNKDRTTENLVSKESGRYYTNVAENLQIREINVNHIKSYSLTLDRGGNTVKLKEGKDYTVTKSESESGTVYIYKISKDIVTDEGSYNIIVRSEDDAGNVNTNAAIRSEGEDSEVPVRFVYDVTPPTMKFIDDANGDNVIELKVDDKNSFRNLSELLLGIIPEDDWALGAIQFVLSNRNGIISDSGVIKGKDFWDVMGEDGIKHFIQKIGNGTDVKTLKVTVWDAAGNETTHEYKIIVTKNVGQLALANWYWILLLLGAAAGGYAYYRYRRDDDDDEDDEDDAA